MSNEYYLNNPLIHKQRQLHLHPSAWVKQFDCRELKPLIICRGPIRKEVMDVFTEMGITHFGILLSEKDSIVYQDALAPELRAMRDPNHVHRVPDYTGANKEEREQRIQQIIDIAKANGYNAIFAGYGFMAEDQAMVAAMEHAGLNFIGPCSRTVHDAGLKDEAKRTALKVGVSVTPGIDNGTALTLLRKYPDVAALKQVVHEHGLDLPSDLLDDQDITLEDKADRVLQAAYDKGIDLYTVEELSETLTRAVEDMYSEYPNNRIRLKAISGGGGKGQRILAAPSAYSGSQGERIQLAAVKTPELIREILNEVKATGVGDNKNVLVELNIETTRHQEIQVVGNGQWSITLGGRDCSLQMHEQKLLEVSVTVESLEAAIHEAELQGQAHEAAVLKQDLKTLIAMEDEAARFGEAVGLDSVSTFECIVDRDKHFFMEMNTRIQVEHRVTELCYAMKFSNPDNPDDFFVVDSLVEAMVLLAAHGPNLPKPERVIRHNDSVEARLNATNHALLPSAGGVIEYWSDAIEGEIRDDQGISLHNPDTDVFIKYTLAGAYDSNIALLLTVGRSRLDTYRQMAETLRKTTLRGKDLATNLSFHNGLVNWFIGNNINARPTTRFIVPYLTAVGEMKIIADQIDLDAAWSVIHEHSVSQALSEHQLAVSECLSAKQTLVQRPVQRLLADPHALSGWLSINKDCACQVDGTFVWNENPIELLNEMYHFLNMEFRPEEPAANVIWSHDKDLLDKANAFYNELDGVLKCEDWIELCSVLDDEEPPKHAVLSPQDWDAVRAAHHGYLLGLDLLLLLPLIAHQADFFSLCVNDDLSIHIPERLLDAEHQAQMSKVLAPPPVAKGDEILAASGGMFYGRETPQHDLYVTAGSHFEAGDPLYIVEVMKMFNKVYAPFSGTIDQVLVEGDGVIIRKGQPLFKVTPDEKIEIESPEVRRTRQHQRTRELLGHILKEAS